jgi:hypothetical protein
VELGYAFVDGRRERRSNARRSCGDNDASHEQRQNNSRMDEKKQRKTKEKRPIYTRGGRRTRVKRRRNTRIEPCHVHTIARDVEGTREHQLHTTTHTQLILLWTVHTKADDEKKERDGRKKVRMLSLCSFSLFLSFANIHYTMYLARGRFLACLLRLFCGFRCQEAARRRSKV